MVFLVNVVSCVTIRIYTCSSIAIEKVANPPNVTKLAKEMENESKSRHHHHLKETHGTSDDIDDETPVEEVKGPGVIQRVKEEVEAVVGAVLPKK